MDNVSRRRFLRDASIGAAALGVAATVGQDALAKLGRPTTGALAPAAAASRLGDQKPGEVRDEVMAHVVGGPSGTIEIYSGTHVITLHDRGVANALLTALG